MVTPPESRKINSKGSRKKEIIKIRVELDKIPNIKSIDKSTKQVAVCKNNKMNKPLARLTNQGNGATITDQYWK
jgi:hypothetical protein